MANKIVNGILTELSIEDVLQAQIDMDEGIAREAATRYLKDRTSEYGSVVEQLEYIVENGVQAFIDKQLAIKAKYPKPQGE